MTSPLALLRPARSAGAPRIVLVANAKGGCGKTTLAATLASAIAVLGRRVCLADADPQRAALGWLGRRPSRAAPIRALDWSRPDRLRERLRSAVRDGVDWIVIDAPSAIRSADGRDRLWRLIALADTVVTPVTPSFFDERATQRFLAVVENCESVRHGQTELLTVANRCPPGRSSALGKRLGTGLEDGIGQGISAYLDRAGLSPLAQLQDRAAYPRLAAQGLALFDRRSARLAPLKAQWAPVLAALGVPRAAA